MVDTGQVDSPGLIASYTPQSEGRPLRLILSLDTEVDAAHFTSVGTGFAAGLRIYDRFELGFGYRRRLTDNDTAPLTERGVRNLFFFRSGLLARPLRWLHLYFGGELGVGLGEGDGQARLVWGLRFKPTSNVHIALMPASPTFRMPSSDSERASAQAPGWVFPTTVEVAVSF